MALLAGGQHGIVSRGQLLVLGMSRDQVQDRVAGSQLHQIHRGVYAVGHRKLTLKGVWMGAVLAAAPALGSVTERRWRSGIWGEARAGSST